MDDIRRSLQYLNGARRCFGCGACAAACLKSAIRMAPDAEGFNYPRIDFTTCVKCGACRRACPVNAENAGAPEDPEFFSLRHRDAAVRRASTSGGAFTVLSDAVLSRGGAVAGAVWDDGFRVRHTVVFDTAGRDAMRGSKYVQSDTMRCFADVRDLLRAGREVLFSGTPCQVAALYSFLGGRDTEKLTTVDFICHGAPSPLAFREYLRHLEQLRGAKLTSFRSRDQKLGCVPMRCGADFADGTTYLADCDSDPYFKLFLSGILNRPCCAGCPYTRVRRGSDLTIADNWRFAAFAPEWDDNTGVSTLLVNTPRGAELLRAAETAAEVLKCTLADVDQHYLHRPGGKHPDRELFFRALSRRGFASAAADFTRPRPLVRRLRSRIFKILGAALRRGGDES